MVNTSFPSIGFKFLNTNSFQRNRILVVNVFFAHRVHVIVNLSIFPMERNDEQEKKRQGDIHSVSLNMDCIGTTIKGTEGAM